MGQKTASRKVSVIIPAYNEEKRIKDCLKAIAKQTVKPYEIIVVDNNCSDTTVDIAKCFEGIKIVSEPRQGLTYARDCGFNTATGDILARIDADTVVPKNWVERIVNEFIDNPELSGVGGFGEARRAIGVPVALKKLLSRFISWAYFKHCQAYFGVGILWGGNMAITKQAWRSIKSLCQHDSMIHEDQDLSLCIASVGGRVKVLSDLLVTVDMYDGQYLKKTWHYIVMKRYTRKLHHTLARSKMPMMLKITWPQRLMYHLLATWVEPIYLTITAYNSLRRAIARLICLQR